MCVKALTIGLNYGLHFTRGNGMAVAGLAAAARHIRWQRRVIFKKREIDYV